MKKEIDHCHLGSYGLIIKNDEILLIKKNSGPYDGLLDLPGGTIEMGETPSDTLVRELKEEVGINVLEYELFDANSVLVDWDYDDNTLVHVHHVGVFYKVLKYDGDIKKEINIDEVNDDSLGADFYKISDLNKKDLSKIVILELIKLGYLKSQD